MLPDHSIAVTGYNGGPSGGPSCLSGECPRGRKTHSELSSNTPYDIKSGSCVALHAEWNVLLRSSWEQTDRARIYVTKEPCHICRVLIAGTRIAEVIWLNSDKNEIIIEQREKNGFVMRMKKEYISNGY